MNRKARKISSRGIVLQALPNDLGIIRVGYTVTKKTQALATKRNRIKRRLRAAAALVIPEHAKLSCDYVLIGRAEAENRPFEALCGDLKWCLEKAGFLRSVA